MATVVRKKPGETEGRLIAKFRKKVQMDQILQELRKREHYRKPSEIKKDKLKAARRQRKRRR